MSDPERVNFDEYLMSRAVDVREADRTIEARFLAFHTRNPAVYRELMRLARQAHERAAHVGIAMLWERLRWSVVVEGLPDAAEAFKLNNDYRSRYARLLMNENADLAGLFEVRALREGIAS